MSPCPRSAAWLMVLRLQTDLVPGSVIYHGLWTLQTLPVTSRSISTSSSQESSQTIRTQFFIINSVSCDWKVVCKRLIIEVLPSIFMPFILWPIPNSNLSPQWSALTYWGSAVELSTNLREVFSVPWESLKRKSFYNWESIKGRPYARPICYDQSPISVILTVFKCLFSTVP